MHWDAARRLHQEADGLIRAMYTGKVGWSARERAIDLKRRAVFATLRADDEATAALHRLIYGLPLADRFLSLEPVLSTLGPQSGNTGFDLLLHLARFHREWLREPEEWRADTDDRGELTSALLRHLFSIYPLPRFLDAGWMSGFTEDAEAQRGWFAHLGLGGKLEALRFPLPMTHRAAHHFLQSPESFSIVAALRRGQIVALGGSEALARTVAESFLAERQSDEEFWLSVVTFLVRHPELPPSQIGPVLDFIRFRRFGSGKNDAPEPRFSMKGRTVDALLRRMEEWHETLARLGQKVRQTWEPTGIPPLDRIERDRLSSATCHWRIVELTDTLSLAEEGREMRHCVRSYSEGCLKGDKSVWSLRLTLSDNPALRRLLTIEVNNHRRSIVQVRGKCNRTLSAMRGNHRMMLARDVLKQWAYSNRLGIGCGL
ncbi:MAG: PcfJ domain-containing protein [Capsulimonadales bacterium]|nr:PcfJ domain-containing protein [Capsulimonadales bacterium]